MEIPKLETKSLHSEEDTYDISHFFKFNTDFITILNVDEKDILEFFADLPSESIYFLQVLYRRRQKIFTSNIQLAFQTLRPLVI